MNKNKYYFNLIHRVHNSKESFEGFKLQQNMAHEAGLKCTIVIDYEALYTDEITRKFKEYNQEYGDELGLLLSITDTEDINESLKNSRYNFWLFPAEVKRKSIDSAIYKFKEVFGFIPAALTTYYLDAPVINYVNTKYPEVKTVIATCFEEGTKVFRGTNYDCFLFSEGSPWNPWIPSKENSRCPAYDEKDDAGVVALPHLSRDMILSIEDRCDYFATHPQNITRGWVYRDRKWNYMYNLFKMIASQSSLNEGYAYSNMYVDPAWVCKANKYDDDVRVDIYRDSIQYLTRLKKSGLLEDMYLSEFSHWFRKNRGYNKPEVVLWRDILCGSDKQLFWYIDSYMRATVDPVQGGAIVDLRPYVARLDRPVGMDTDNLHDGSYPFVLHTQYRGGWPAFMDTKSMFTCAVSYKGEVILLRKIRTECTFEKQGPLYIVKMEPAELEFSETKAVIRSEVLFHGNGKIETRHYILESSDRNGTFEVLDFFNGCWGTNEYHTDLKGIRMGCVGRDKTECLEYQYLGIQKEVPDIEYVYAEIPHIKTGVKLYSENETAAGVICDGVATGPFYTLGIRTKVKVGEEVRVWIALERLP